MDKGVSETIRKMALKNVQQKEKKDK